MRPERPTKLQLLVWTCLLLEAAAGINSTDNEPKKLIDVSSIFSALTGANIINKTLVTNLAQKISKHFQSTQDHIPGSDVATQSFQGTDTFHSTAPSTDHGSDSGSTTSTSSQHESHPCLRECRLGAPPMTCYYHFEVEGYLAMSKACYNCPVEGSDCSRPDCVPADGATRPLFVVNRQLPGPSIEVCHGDRVVVDVVNQHIEQSTTIHWHGIHQVDTPYMDGVPFVTQCPIQPGDSFRYDFTASPAGTHFWHSHLGVQRANGLFGALIVRTPPQQDPNAHLFDYDLPAHTMQVLDWDHVTSTDKFMDHLHGTGDNKPPTLLINGRGRNYEAGSDTSEHVPDVRFTVKKGGRYRFRLINAGFLNCPIQVSVDGHNITVIASDSSSLQPIQAESLVTYAGERYDFVLTANRPISNYWVRLRGLLDCGDRFKSAHQVAVLHYEGATTTDPEGELSYTAASRKGLQINTVNARTGTAGSVIIPELNSALVDDVRLKPEADLTFYISYDFYHVDNPLFHRKYLYGYSEVRSAERRGTPQLNHISMKLPESPLLSQLSEADPSMFCNGSSVDPICRSHYCACTHLLRVPLHAVVELILIDEGGTPGANHPFHLHGADFRVIAMDVLGENATRERVQALDQSGLIRRKLKGAPVKDDVTVPNGGYTILRFQGNNPGFWMFHCHLDFHSEIGMSLVFQIGEPKDFPPVPEDFPRCGVFV